MRKNGVFFSQNGGWLPFLALYFGKIKSISLSKLFASKSSGKSRRSRIVLVLLAGLMATVCRLSADIPLTLHIVGPADRDVITGTLSYEVDVTNLSPSPVYNVDITDTLPGTAELMSATNQYAGGAATPADGTRVTFTIARINGSETARMRLRILPSVTGSITNIVTLSIPMDDSIAATNVFTVRSTQLSIHDPAMAKEDGIYYLFSSGPGIMFYTSADMVHWRIGGRIFAGEPSWAESVAKKFDGREWAPDISYHNDEYYLYYAVSASGENDSAIGLAINKTLDPAAPGYQWQDQGIVLRSIPNRDLWNAIDPNIIVDDDGTPWMDFGSFWGGIKLVKLASDYRTIAEPEKWYSLAKLERSVLEDDRSPGPAQIEGPFIFKKGDYYYLFVSWGLCCLGENSTYKIVVGRSTDVRGPYLDKDGMDMALGGGSILLPGDQDWAGQGGCSVYTFDSGDYLIFHAYEMADDGLQKLRIAKLDWDTNGWPVIDEAYLDNYKSLVVK
jgi:arabinan endo-1,5-alpha-L-arabinosidase